MSKNIYIVYETTNLINGKYYVGVHKKNGSDYLGSGKILRFAVEKYGKENFIRETLKEFKIEDDAYEFEKKIVDEKLIKNINCYNICRGGDCGPCLCGKDNPRYGTHHTIETRLKMSGAAIGRKVTDETKKKLSILNSGKNNPNFGMKGKLNPKYGRKAKESTKILQSEAHKGKKAYNSKKWLIHGKMFYSLSEAAKKLNVNYQTISNWCKLYKIPHCYCI